jgi:hypothetical protein
MALRGVQKAVHSFESSGRTVGDGVQPAALLEQEGVLRQQHLSMTRPGRRSPIMQGESQPMSLST